MAFIMLATLSVPLVGMKMRSKPSTHRKLIDHDAWHEASYALFGVAEFFGFMGLCIAFFYVQVYSVEKRIILDSLKVYLLVLLNAGSLF